jgi:segregation and condensation protein B
VTGERKIFQEKKVDKERLCSILESVLYVSREPLSLGQLCDLIPEADRAEVKSALELLANSCEHPSRGVRLNEVAGGYQFQTDSDNSLWVGRLMKQRPVRLSRPALETLSIIAYRQPVTRPEIEDIRGVDSGGVVHTLLEHDFIRMEGRKDVPGRPIIYGTTKRFLEFFRLKSLSELPTLKELEDMQEEVMRSQGAEGPEESEEGTGPGEEQAQPEEESGQAEVEEESYQSSPDESPEESK